jgi:hypothetical protein
MKLGDNGKVGSIDIVFDEFTPCLIEKSTGKVFDTEFNKVDKEKVTGLRKKGWRFTWTKPFKSGYDVYELRLKGDYEVQGLMAIRPEPGSKAVHIDIVETAPHNFGSSGIYKGVGAHLFAIAVKISFEQGFDGYVYFTAKSDLIEYYEAELGAILVNARLRIMVIDEEAALVLYKRYFKESR